MDKKEINNLTKEQLDEELFREISCSWEKDDLVSYIVDNMKREDKLNWVEQWFEDGE